MVPLRFDQGASKAAKELVVFWWCPDRLVFVKSSIEQWLNSEEDLLSALLLVGAGGKGKSKLAANGTDPWTRVRSVPLLQIACEDPRGAG
jgi:hypothetical protein